MTTYSVGGLDWAAAARRAEHHLSVVRFEEQRKELSALLSLSEEQIDAVLKEMGVDYPHVPRYEHLDRVLRFHTRLGELQAAADGEKNVQSESLTQEGQ